MAVAQRVFYFSGESEFGRETIDGFGPVADGAFSDFQKRFPESGTELSQFDRKIGGECKNGDIPGGKKSERGDHGGGPGDAGFFGDESGCEGDGVRNEKVGVLDGCECVFVSFLEYREQDFAYNADGSPAEIHHTAHHVLGSEPMGIGPNGMKAEAQCLDFLLIALAGRDDDVVAAFFQSESDGDIGMEIPEASHRGEDDSFCFVILQIQLRRWFHGVSQGRAILILLVLNQRDGSRS